MQIYAAYHKRRFQQSRKPYVLVFGLLASFLVVIFLTIREITKPGPVSPIVQAKMITPSPVPTSKPKNKEALQKAITNALDDSVPQYSIIVDDFLTPFHLELGDQIPFIGASTHKIFILGSVYQQIEKGELDIEKRITFQEEERQDYGTGQMRYRPAGEQYTIKELVTLMMKHSDNTAAYILANDVLTQELIQKNVTSWGLYETNMKQNITTNADVNKYFRKLFTGSLFSSSSTRQAIDLFTDSEFEDRLPALLPRETRVYHKIGTTIAGLHDAGVIASNHSFYYVGIFTKGVSDEERATRAIARTSKAIYEFMNE